MKKLLYVFSVVALLLVSCSKDDDSNAQATIIGKWYFKGGTINNGSFINYNNDCSTKMDFQEFFANGELVFNGFNSSCELDDVETSNWVKNGNTLTVSNTNFDPMIYNYTYTIEKLDASKLILKQTVTEPEGVFVYRNTFTGN